MRWWGWWEKVVCVIMKNDIIYDFIVSLIFWILVFDFWWVEVIGRVFVGRGGSGRVCYDWNVVIVSYSWFCELFFGGVYGIVYGFVVCVKLEGRI